MRGKKMIENTYPDTNRHHKVAMYFLIDDDATDYVGELPMDKYDGYVNEANWTYVDTFIDKIKDGNREHTEFDSMIDRCKQGEIDLIITPSFYYFAPTLEISLKTVAELSALPSPVGVFFVYESANTLVESGYKRHNFWSTVLNDLLRPYKFTGDYKWIKK